MLICLDTSIVLYVLRGSRRGYQLVLRVLRKFRFIASDFFEFATPAEVATSMSSLSTLFAFYPSAANSLIEILVWASNDGFYMATE